MVRQLGRWSEQWGPWPGRFLGGMALLLIGVAAGLASVRYGLATPLGLLAGLALALGATFEPWAGLLCAIGIAILLPFGVLPVRLGFTPSFLELTLLGFLAGWLLPPLLRGERRYRFSVLDALAWAFIALTLFALLLGWGRGVDTTVLHNYGKLLLGLLAFFGIRQVANDGRRVRRLMAVLLVAAGLAALLGLVLYALPDPTALKLLTRLEVVGYPAGGRVLRYVEDDPGGLERAIGTGVDPNSFGGMLALAAAIALGEVLAAWRPANPEERPALPLPVLLLILALLLAGVYLSYSRAALGGFVVACLFLAVARYRRLWWGILGGVVLLAVLMAGLGWSSPAVERFRQGILFQDRANRMRLAEFSNAIAIVHHYPVFGVGFGSAPDVDLSTGVSSLYLTIAERMGLVGLAAFLAFVGAAVVRGLALAAPRYPVPFSPRFPLPEGRGDKVTGEQGEGHRLALLAGAVAALAVGLLDHYFFNPEFPHMAMLLWAVLGIAARPWSTQS